MTENLSELPKSTEVLIEHLYLEYVEIHIFFPTIYLFK